MPENRKRRIEHYPTARPRIDSAADSVEASLELATVPVATLEILFIDHSRDNERRILEAMVASSADIVAMELVGNTSSVRKLVEDKINEAINIPNPRQRAQYMQGISQPFKNMAWALAGTGKKIVFIDLASDDSRYASVRKAKMLRSSAYSPAATQSDKDTYIRAFGESIAIRDTTLAEQLTALRIQNPDNEILAVMGAAHKGAVEKLEQTFGEGVATKESYLPRYGEEIELTGFVAAALKVAQSLK